jgi:hypothetical protein
MTAANTKRILLTDAAVKREPFAEGKPRIVRDTKVAGFHLWIGKRKKTFRYQYEAPRLNGHRGSTNIEWLGEHPHHSADQARAKAVAIQARRARGESVRNAAATEVPPPALTFQQAWQHYKAAITKEGKSPRTIADYQDKFDRHLKEWHERLLATITREEVTREHGAITERARSSRFGNKYASGKYAANGCMRFARAVWNFAKNELETPGLPDRNPFRSSKLYHKERARETGMGAGHLAGAPQSDPARAALVHATLRFAPRGPADGPVGPPGQGAQGAAHPIAERWRGTRVRSASIHGDVALFRAAEGSRSHIFPRARPDVDIPGERRTRRRSKGGRETQGIAYRARTPPFVPYPCGGGRH